MCCVGRPPQSGQAPQGAGSGDKAAVVTAAVKYLKEVLPKLIGATGFSCSNVELNCDLGRAPLDQSLATVGFA
jgi:hypothetical protein